MSRRALWEKVFFEGGFCKNVRLSWLWRSECQCTAGPNILGCSCFLGRDARLCRNPLCQNPLFLVPESNKNIHFGRDGVRDKREPSVGTNWSSSVEFHSKITSLSRLSLGRVGYSSPGRLSRKDRQKNVYVFSFIFSPPI